MLDLFRLEAEEKLRLIATCLHQLAHGARPAKPLTTCMYAAGSLKDAAQMAELPTVVSLAQGLESCIKINQRGRHGPRLSTIDLFQRCTELLGRMARAQQADSAAGTGLHAETQKLLASLRQRELAALAPPVTEIPPEAMVPVAAPVPTPAPAAARPAPPLLPPPPAVPPPPPPAVPAQVIAPMISGGFDDVPLLELFRQEAEELSKTMFNGLRVLRFDPYSARQIESCMRAAHSFKGAARISGLSVAVELSRGLEECFAAARDRSISLSREAVELLSAALDLLMRVTRVPEQARQGSKNPEVDAFLAALKRLSRGIEPVVIPQLPAQS